MQKVGAGLKYRSNKCWKESFVKNRFMFLEGNFMQDGVSERLARSIPDLQLCSSLELKLFSLHTVRHV